MTDCRELTVGGGAGREGGEEGLRERTDDDKTKQHRVGDHTSRRGREQNCEEWTTSHMRGSNSAQMRILILCLSPPCSSLFSVALIINQENGYK